MKKRFLVFCLLLALMLPLCAQAASHAFQEISSYSNGAVREEFKQNKDDYRMTAYKALDGNGEGYAYAYADFLNAFGEFSFLGAYSTEEWVHLCLSAAGGYNFDTFRLVSYGEALTPYSVVIVSYKPNSKTIYVRYSYDLMLRDLGYRASYASSGGQQQGSGLVQEPVSYSYNAVRHTDDIPKDDYRQKAYKVLNGRSADFVYTYSNMLDRLSNLTYLGVYDTGNWVHHCFSEENGYNYDTFRLTSYGEALTPYSVVIVSWKEDTSTIYVRYSKDISLTDLGYRR